MKNQIMLLLLTVGIVVSCSTKETSKKEISTYPITHPLLVDTSYISEYVADIQSVKNIEIRARVSGFIDQIHIDEGEYVKKNQLLFTINNKQYKENVLIAKAGLKSSEASLKSAKVEYLNMKILCEKNIVSKTELEKAEAMFESAKSNVDQSKSELNSAMIDLSLTRILAPFDGVVNRIPNKKGSLINEGSLLTSLSDNKDVYAYFNVSEREYLDFISQKKRVNEVLLRLANNELHSDKGVVESIDGEIDKSTGNIAFRAKFPNPKDVLRHGSSGKILLSHRLNNVVLIPQKSTFEIQEKTYVYVVDKEHIVHSKSITPLHRMPNMYVVSPKEISLNTKILFEGIQNVKNGDKIHIVNKLH